MFEIFSKTKRNFRKNNLGDIRKGYFVLEKEIFFERVRLKNGQKKKTKPKGEEKLKVFRREIKKEMKKATQKKHKDPAKKGEKSFFL